MVNEQREADALFDYLDAKMKVRELENQIDSEAADRMMTYMDSAIQKAVHDSTQSIIDDLQQNIDAVVSDGNILIDWTVDGQEFSKCIDGEETTLDDMDDAA